VPTQIAWLLQFIKELFKNSNPSAIFSMMSTYYYAAKYNLTLKRNTS
jgi:hypothetical protein